MNRLFASLALGGLIATTISPAFADAPAAPAAPALPADAKDAKPASTVESLMAGTFAFSGSESERDARKQAIEKGIAGMFFAVRGIGRNKVDAKTKIAASLVFRFDNNMVRCVSPGAPDAVSPVNGSAVDYTTSDGESVKLSQRVDGGRLVQTFTSPDGTRTNIYVPSSDGERYAMRATVQSPKLTVPVAFTLTYARKH